MGLSYAELGGLVTVAVTLIGAFVSVAKLRTDSRSAIVTHFKTLVDTYLEEIKRLNAEKEETEKDRLEQVKALKDEISTLLANHKQEVAEVRAEYIQEIAQLKAEHTSETAALRLALQELKNLLAK